MGEPVIVEAIRTPLGRRNGALRDVHPVDLGAFVLNTLADRVGLDPAEVGQVIWGAVSQVGEQSINVGRNTVIAAGWPVEIPAASVDFQCGSSQEAINLAAALVKAGVHDCVVAGGVESMTRVPMGSSLVGGSPVTKRWTDRYEFVHQGISAEMIADRWHISREALDQFSLQSHQRAATATRTGRFNRELAVVPVQALASAPAADGSAPSPFIQSDGSFRQDEGIRSDTSLEKLASLNPAFAPKGHITAGNSSQISDGAAATLVVSEEFLAAHHWSPRARIVSQTVVGVDPTLMLTGPIPATRQILDRHHLSIDDLDVIEINEAFASVVLAWAQEFHPDMDRVNIHGGAIALGHPLGCSGSRLMATLLGALDARHGRYGLQTMCCGGGLGIATLVERLA